jgi:DNA-binding transcriptional LysR family regulator
MEIRDLIFLEAIAEEGHWGRAAERLGRTKPALTKCIRRLEQEIGGPLFQRVGRRSILTETGITLVDHAKHLHSALDDALKNVADLTTGRAGHVRLGVGTSIVEYLLPQLCSWFLKDAPQVTMELRTGHGDVLRAGLAEGKLDGIVTSSLPTDVANFTKEDWFIDEVVVVARRHHPLAGKRLRIGDLTQYDWVLPSQTAASRQWIDWAFKSRNLPAPRVRAEVSSARLVSSFIEQSDLLSFASRRTLLPGGMAAQLTELPLKEATMQRTLSFLCRRNAYIPPTLKRLATALHSSGTPPTPVHEERNKKRRNRASVRKAGA